MSEENIYVDTLVTEDMNKDELYDYAKYLEYRKEELLNINHSLQQKVEQLENIRKEAIEFINEWLFEAGGNGADMDYDTIVDLLNILNKGSEKE